MKYAENSRLRTFSRLRSLTQIRAVNALAMLVTMLALVASATPASAGRRIALAAIPPGNCLENEYGKALQCTANDVSIAKATNVTDLNGIPLTSCDAGSTVSLMADFTVVTTASARENIGLYFQTAGGSTALTGTCSDNIIAPLHSLNDQCTGTKAPFPCCTGVGAGTCGSVGEKTSGAVPIYEELDAAPDNCGDISTADNNQVVRVLVKDVKCEAAPGTNKLILPNCTSWQQPGGTNLCVSSPPAYPYPNPPAAVPGSPSKCNCDNTFILDVNVQSPGASVSKTCTVGGGSASTSCTLSPEGGTVTYTVDVTNKSSFGSIVVDQICDSAYGNVYTVKGFAGPPCGAGSTGLTSTGGTCSSGLTVGTGDSSCTFTAVQPENQTVTNAVTIVGHGSTAGTFGPTSSNTVMVTSGEAVSKATVTKSLVGTQSGCATVRYSIDMQNSGSADEDLTLTGITDDQIDVTKLSSTILGTTCGQAGNGLGTMNNLTGAGALGTLTVGGSDYLCQFDAEFCGTLATITLPDGVSKCTGIQKTDTVTGTFVGDDGVLEPVTVTPGTLTVDECFSTYSK